LSRKASISEKMADKVIKLLADGTLSSFDWKHNIPFYVVHGNFPVVRNAKNFADGLNYHMKLYDRDLPEEYIVGDFPATGDEDSQRQFEFERDLRFQEKDDRFKY
jgi:hypothetical protein